MGYKYTVSVWLWDPDLDRYAYEPYWSGKSLVKAVWKAKQAERKIDTGCVRLEIR